MNGEGFAFFRWHVLTYPNTVQCWANSYDAMCWRDWFNLQKS